MDRGASDRRRNPKAETVRQGVAEVASNVRHRKVTSIAVAILMAIIAVLCVVGECRLWVDLGGGHCDIWTFFLMFTGIGVFGLAIFIAERMVENAEQNL